MRVDRILELLGFCPKIRRSIVVALKIGQQRSRSQRREAFRINLGNRSVYGVVWDYIPPAADAIDAHAV